MSTIKVDTIKKSDGAGSIEVNRITSDGDILELQKDGTTVGSIGTKSGDAYIALNSSRGLTVTGHELVPTNASGTKQAGGYMDLGSSSYPFHNAYINGGVYLGGTGSANKLDDYEEGTWNITSPHVTLSPTAGNNNYVKIGRLVCAQFDVTFPASSSGTSTTITLPFSSVNYGSGSVGWDQGNETILLHTAGFSLNLMQAQGTSNAHLSYAEAANKRYIGSVTYYASS